VLILAGGAAAAETAIGRALASAPLSWLGRISYPLYLWHWPLMVLGAVLVPTISPWGRLAWGVFAIIPAYLSQRLIERPLHSRIAAWVSGPEQFMYAVGVSLALTLTAHWAALRSTRHIERSAHRTFAAARADRMEHSCWARSADQAPRASCAFGDKNSDMRLALLGDSHAEHWLGGLDRAGKARGWRIDANVMGGCPVSDFSRLISGSTARRYRECSRYREATLQRIIAQRPTAVILSSFDSYMGIEGGERHEYQVTESAWREGLRRTYARLAAARIPVIVLRGTPRVPFDVPSCLSRRAERLPFASDCQFTIDRAFRARAQLAQDVAARGLNVRFVDMNDQVCATTRCPTIRDGVVMFTDDNHLTAGFTKSVGLVLADRLSGALGAH
ncbi:MAG: SGNH hydrolase domain-containing protein, partial [Gemmatimonas sp.]